MDSEYTLDEKELTVLTQIIKKAQMRGGVFEPEELVPVGLVYNKIVKIIEKKGNQASSQTASQTASQTTSQDDTQQKHSRKKKKDDPVSAPDS